MATTRAQPPRSRPRSVRALGAIGLGAGLLGRLGAARTFALALVPLVTMPLVSCAITADGGEVEAAVLVRLHRLHPAPKLVISPNQTPSIP